MERLLKAIKNLLPFIHENGMEGETKYERAVIELEKAYEAAQQSVERTADNMATCPHGILENMACRLCGD